MSGQPDVFHRYEKVVKQFGFVVLFSFVFPIAGLLSFISNSFEMGSQIRNFKYQRRFRAQMSYGIGNWMGCLENLSQLAIIW